MNKNKYKNKDKFFYGITGVVLFITFLVVIFSGGSSTEIKDNTHKQIIEEVQKVPELEEASQQEVQEEVIPKEIKESVSNFFEVTYIVDGDTLDISTGERVRLICIDTPERGEELYSEAGDYLEKLTLNKEVELVKDISETDRYDRLLRYIYVGNTFVNYELVKKGYAKAYPYAPDTSKCPEIQEAEEYAKSNKLGIWAEQEEEEETTSSNSNSNIVCSSNYYNCGDFSSCSAVMEVFDTCSSDIHRLDGDDDGIPCESLCG